MLTDIFAFRYAEKLIWKSYSKKEKRLLVQTFSIIDEQLSPYYVNGNESSSGKKFWTDIHNKLAVELGLKSLSQLGYSYQNLREGKQSTVSGLWTINTVCENWVHAVPQSEENIDDYMKERLSLVEIAFRLREENITIENAKLPKKLQEAKQRPANGLSGIVLPGDRGKGILAWNKKLNEEFQGSVKELNTRFQQAGCKLHYHNGFIQLSDDTLFLEQVEQPFWQLVADPIWKNVDTDMKEAFDRRDSGSRDPSFYAARALESTIKIISDRKGWTHGREKGAHNYIDNLGKKSSSYISGWEVDFLKAFFTKVRNPLGHGSGSEPMPSLSTQQTSIAIEFCISWIKSLVTRM